MASGTDMCSVRAPAAGWTLTSIIPSGPGGDDDAELGRQATELWNRTQARLTGATSPALKEAILHDLTDALDDLSSRYRLDTLRREQAGEAARLLTEEHLGEAHRLTEWIPD